MSAIKKFQECTQCLNDLSKAAVGARTEVQKLLTVLEGPAENTEAEVNAVINITRKVMPADGIDPAALDGAGDETALDTGGEFFGDGDGSGKAFWPGVGPYDTFGLVRYRPFPAQDLKGESKDFLNGILCTGTGCQGSFA